MTPTTSSSAITLLKPAAQTGKLTPANADPAQAGSAKAASGAASSGFELLLGAVQELQAKASGQTAETGAADKSTGKSGDKSDADSGKTLPPAGTILPVQIDAAAQAGIAAQATQPTTDAGDGAKGDGDEHEKDDDHKTDKVDPAAGAVMVLPALAPATPAVTNAAASAQVATDTATAQAGKVDDGGGSRKGSRAGDDLLQQKQAQASARNDAAATDTDTLVAATGASAAAAKSAPAAAKASSDFDALMKHFDTPAAHSAAAHATDSASAASRTYLDTANSLAQSSANNSAQNAANNAASIPVPVGSNGWSDAVADKVMWFSANKMSSAEIHLNPPDLGPLQVRVTTHHDQTSVAFTSQHAAVRDALDQALPRLRDMMGNQGMHLLDVSVGGQTPQQQQPQQQFARGDGGGDRSNAFAGLFGDDAAANASVSVTAVSTARLLRSGVDAYA